ncbi:unnamed protein product [Closterium sp. NIES-65]|nr:unnamed protein product [Closterium sp. NIES-65]
MPIMPPASSSAPHIIVHSSAPLPQLSHGAVRPYFRIESCPLPSALRANALFRPRNAGSELVRSIADNPWRKCSRRERREWRELRAQADDSTGRAQADDGASVAGESAEATAQVAEIQHAEANSAVSTLVTLFPLWVALACAAALRWPAHFVVCQDSRFVVGGLALTMLGEWAAGYGMGLTISVDDFRRAVLMPRQLLAGVLLQYTVMPCLGALVSRGLPPHLSAFATGLVLVACCPGGQCSRRPCHTCPIAHACTECCAPSQLLHPCPPCSLTSLPSHLTEIFSALPATSSPSLHGQSFGPAACCHQITAALPACQQASSSYQLWIVILSTISSHCLPLRLLLPSQHAGHGLFSYFSHFPLPLSTLIVPRCGNRGNVALSVLMTTFSTLLAVVMTPLLTSLLAGRFVPVNGAALFMSTLQVVMLPVFTGCLLARLFPAVARHLALFSPVLAVLTVALIVAGAISGSAATIRGAALPLLLSVLALHGLGFALGYLLPRAVLRLDESASRTISIEVGMQNSVLGVVLAMQHFPDPRVAAPCAVSSVMHSLCGSLLAAAWRATPVLPATKGGRVAQAAT